MKQQRRTMVKTLYPMPETARLKAAIAKGKCLW